MKKAERLKTATLALATLLAAIVLPLYAVKVSQKMDYMDFDVYYKAAARAKALDWTHIYDAADGKSPFRYAPVLIPLLRPFAELTRDQAKMVWYFLQFAAFGLGFYFLYLALRSMRRARSHALWITAIGFLMILRLCLDTFTIGQVASFMFLGFALSLYAWMIRRPFMAASALFIPTVLKIGPGILYFLFLFSRKPERRRAMAAPFLLLSTLLGLGLIFTRSFSRYLMLWRGWRQMVVTDSSYYDASHYGSQSIKSFLLRLANSGWLSGNSASHLYAAAVVLGSAAILVFWLMRRPRSMHARGLFFSLGLFGYMWFMPETFKYSLTPIAIPVVLLLSASRRPGRPGLTPLDWVALSACALTISLPGKDVVGDALFFPIQKLSLPLFATFLLGAACFRAAWIRSKPSRLAELLDYFFRLKKEGLGPWPVSPRRDTDLKASFLIPLPLESAVTVAPGTLREAVTRFSGMLRELFSDSFEIIVSPYGNRLSQYHPLMLESKKLQAELPEARSWLRFTEGLSQGRGAALRTGFLSSRGNLLLAAHLEQLCDPRFYQDALRTLHAGEFDLVRANRRHPETRFRIPVKLLPLVYGRHRLGLWFNRIVRWILPIGTTDTHSGSWLMTRRLALRAFAEQVSSDFLFDLEISLTARGHGFRETDLPVTLFLQQEKQTLRMGRETLAILHGLPILARRYREGCYQPHPEALGITADDWGLSPGVNRGILELAKQGVVRRVSMMAGCKYLDIGLDELKKIPGIELGLHFNLTYGPRADRHPSPGKFLKLWLSPFEDHKSWVKFAKDELDTQLAALSRSGVRPCYLDGHHHIHLVPGLLKELGPRIREAGITKIRLPYDGSLWFSSKFSLNLLSLLARGRLRKFGFDSMDCIYPQAPYFQDHGRLAAHLAKNPHAEVIVHPAEVNDIGTLEFPDTYTEGRVIEFHALQMLAYGGRRS